MKGTVSSHITEHYKPFVQPFDKLEKMVTRPGWHWVNHNLKKGYRSEENVIPGFNMVVLDVENSVDIPTAQLLLKDFTFLIHTTKKHTNENHRYRVIMPISHE
jgi:hypothetical protein